MLAGQLRRLPGCSAPLCGRSGPQAAWIRSSSASSSRGALQVAAVGDFGKFFDKLKGGGKGDGGDDVSRKDAFGSQKRFGGGDGGGGQGRGGGSGGGGSGGFGAADEGGSGNNENRSVMSEIWEAMRYTWTVFWNLALFLAFADVLHRSLDWCCSVELLFLVGAPQQAFERLAGRFFAVIEWVERNMLGWDIPGEEDMIPQYENIRLFYPRQHAYTFDQYRYPVNAQEKDTLINAHALRYYEREGGHVGDVDPADLAAIKAKYDPLEADRLEYQQAKAANRLEDYWAKHKATYERVTGQRFVRPPGTPAPTS